MRIDPASSSGLQNISNQKNTGKQGASFNTTDSFKSVASDISTGILDMKKAAEIVTTNKLDSVQKFDVLWTFQPEKVEVIRKGNSYLRKRAKEKGRKFLQEYMDSIGKPYFYQPEITGTPALSKNGNILVATTTHGVYSLSPDGKPTLIKDIPHEECPSVSNMQQSPSGDIVFLSLKDLYRLNPKSGLLAKFQSIKEEPSNDFGIGKDGTIYRGTWEKETPNSLYALNPDDTVKWKTPIGKKIVRGNPVEDNNGNIHVNTMSGDYLVFSPRGEKLVETSVGKYEHTSTNRPSISPDGKKAYMGTRKGDVICLSTKDGKELWRKNIGNGYINGINLDKDGNVYAAYQFGKIAVMDSDGNDKWSAKLTGRLGTSPAFDESGNIYQACEDGSLNCFDSKGNPQWKAKITATTATPVIDKSGNIYIRSRSGNLQAVKSNTFKEIIEKSGEMDKTTGESTVPTIEIGDGFITIGGVKVKVQK